MQAANGEKKEDALFAAAVQRFEQTTRNTRSWVPERVDTSLQAAKDHANLVAMSTWDGYKDNTMTYRFGKITGKPHINARCPFLNCSDCRANKKIFDYSSEEGQPCFLTCDAKSLTGNGKRPHNHVPATQGKPKGKNGLVGALKCEWNMAWERWTATQVVHYFIGTYKGGNNCLGLNTKGKEGLLLAIQNFVSLANRHVMWCGTTNFFLLL